MNPFQGNLTDLEYRELLALEYVLTWGYSEDVDVDDKRYKELSKIKWDTMFGGKYKS